MDRRDAGPRPDVPYVRDRTWLRCGRCRLDVVVDAGELRRDAR